MQIHLALDEPPQLAGPRGRAARAHGDRPRDARPRRRLARRQRGRARAAARRGDDRRRPAVRGRPVARAGGQVDHLDPAAGAAAAAEGRCRSARSTSATARGARSCARRTPTASSRGSARQIDEPRRRDAQARRALARRPRGAQPQPRRRRHLLRLVRARPEPALAAARRSCPATRTRSTGSGTSARARTPGRVSAPARATSSRRSCEAAARRSGSSRKLPRPLVRLSLSEISTSSASFAEDVAAYAAAGFDGIGIWEFKLPTTTRRTSRCSREPASASRTACPTVPVAPAARDARHGRPADPAERGRRCARAWRAWPASSPTGPVPDGPAGDRSEAEARALVIDGLQQVAAAARDAGVPLGLEPMHPSQREDVVRDVDQRRGRAARRGAARRRRAHGRQRSTSGTTRRCGTSRPRLVPHRRRPRRRLAVREGAPAACSRARASRVRRSSSPPSRRRLGRLPRRRDLLRARGLLGPRRWTRPPGAPRRRHSARRLDPYDRALPDSPRAGTSNALKPACRELRNGANRSTVVRAGLCPAGEAPRPNGGCAPRLSRPSGTAGSLARADPSAARLTLIRSLAEMPLCEPDIRSEPARIPRVRCRSPGEAGGRRATTPRSGQTSACWATCSVRCSSSR